MREGRGRRNRVTEGKEQTKQEAEEDAERDEKTSDGNKGRCERVS